MPKGFQKAARRYEKDIQKASTKDPDAISKCFGTSIGNSISNAIANAIATAIGNRSPLRSLHQARWREGRRQVSGDRNPEMQAIGSWAREV